MGVAHLHRHRRDFAMSNLNWRRIGMRLMLSALLLLLTWPVASNAQWGPRNFQETMRGADGLMREAETKKEGGSCITERGNEPILRVCVIVIRNKTEMEDVGCLTTGYKQEELSDIIIAYAFEVTVKKLCLPEIDGPRI